MQRIGKIFFLTIIILTVIFRLDYLLGPVDKTAEETIVVRIESGSSSLEIANLLREKGLLKSQLLFQLYLSITGLDDDLKAGLYEFKQSDNLQEIVRKLVKGEIATFKVTIPEGFTLEEIAERLAAKTAYSKEDFLTTATAAYFNKEYLPSEQDALKYRLEGFLYPDTYIIPQEYSPQEILELMLKEFEKQWWGRLKELSKEDLRGYSPYEIIIIASLIEEEAQLSEEKPLIAAVIYNRLERDMLLQLDASVQYSLPSRKERVLYRDLKVDSPYNTYLHPGLPPGPVCSPGDDSIEAALNPAQVDYLFYFALQDGSHYFSRTYEEHLSAQRKLRDQGE